MGSVNGTIFELFQISSLILSFAFLYFSIKRAKQIKTYLLDLPIIILAIHSIIYYLSVFANRYGFLHFGGTTPFTFWSTALRFHAYATIFMIVHVGYLRGKGKWI